MSEINIAIKPCMMCNEQPKIADVGGNNPFYEIHCSHCGNPLVVCCKDLSKGIEYWNEKNTR